MLRSDEGFIILAAAGMIFVAVIRQVLLVWETHRLNVAAGKFGACPATNASEIRPEVEVRSVAGPNER